MQEEMSPIFKLMTETVDNLLSMTLPLDEILQELKSLLDKILIDRSKITFLEKSAADYIQNFYYYQIEKPVSIVSMTEGLEYLKTYIAYFYRNSLLDPHEETKLNSR
jgi:hypothetical protein